MKIYTKICGITRECDAECAINSGVDALGFIAFPKSKRYITPTRFGELSKFIDKRVPCVCVFVDPSQKEIDAYIELGADIIQLHGNEKVDFIEKQTQPVWKAINLHSEKQIADSAKLPVEKILIDAFVKDADVPGGMGKKANWVLARKAVKELTIPVILAGGLNQKNIIDAIRKVNPSGVDISSGIEDSPGIKNHHKIQALLKIIHSQ
ncbi:MAG: phosphoribosylanthranilate isomerase [Verrucomicrobiota bacterium]|nr:phosphoribosylanthranilate isomerase [Verrucomicrobiota bacterium]